VDTHIKVQELEDGTCQEVGVQLEQGLGTRQELGKHLEQELGTRQELGKHLEQGLGTRQELEELLEQVDPAGPHLGVLVRFSNPIKSNPVVI